MTMTPMSHTTLPAGTLRLPRPFTHSRGTGRRQQWATAPRASKEGPESGAVVNEELLAKLKASQEEAERLKRELAAAQASSGAAAAERPAPAAKRIDSGDLRRETLFTTESKQRNWLNESDVNFFTGGGPSELGEGAAAPSEEEQSTVKRRLLVGLGLTAALGAFALVPTEKLQPPPSKPLFFYLVPLLRIQALLEEAEALVPEGNYAQLKALIARIEGPPNNLQENLRAAAASLPDSRRAAAATDVGREVFELVEQIDYNKYFESMGAPPRGGKVEQQYYDFSLQSAKAAQVKLREFLQLMPRDQLEAAQLQVSTAPF